MQPGIKPVRANITRKTATLEICANDRKGGNGHTERFILNDRKIFESRNKG
jgi:hypothetical protein